MAQAYVTTYEFFHRGRWQDRPETYNPYKLTEIEPEEDADFWRQERGIASDETDDAYLEEGAKLVKKMILKRLRSTYQVSYCKKRGKYAVAEEKDMPKGGELLEYCKNLYGIKTKKPLPLLPTSRRLLGYIRPARGYTPLTRYQHEIGRGGYALLDR